MNSSLGADRQSTEAGIVCLAFMPFSGTGILKGLGDFHVARWHLRIFGCMCRRRGDSRWVQLPCKPLIDKAGQALRDGQSGKICYVQVVAFDEKELIRRFSDAACVALDAYQEGWDH